jgi:hypothetical protein
MLIRLRRQGVKLSRNRNYDLFESKVARRALKLHRMLRHLERELLRYTRHEGVEVRLGPAKGQRRVIEVSVPLLCLRRTIYLGAQELELLRETPELERLLRVEEGEGPDEVVGDDQVGG